MLDKKASIIRELPDTYEVSYLIGLNYTKGPIR